MADANRVLEILLKLQADTAGAASVTTALKEIEAQAAATAETVRSIKDTTALPTGFDAGSSAEARALRAELDASAAARQSAKVTATETVAVEELSAAAQEKIALQMERRVILETEIEAAEARIAGNTALAARLEREADIRARSLGIQRTMNVTTEEAIGLAEQLVAAEEATRSAREQEILYAKAVAEADAANLAARKAGIVDLETRAAELRAVRFTDDAIGPSSEAGAAALEREADLRTRALKLQQSLNIEASAALGIAERQIAAEEGIVAAKAESLTLERAQSASAMVTGLNLGKARAESITLARELANGSANGRTLGALLGSLGPTLTIAGLAAYELYHVITASSEESLKFTREIEKQTHALSKEVEQWIWMAEAAKKFDDTAKLGHNMDRALEEMTRKMNEFRTKELSLWAQFWDSIVSGFRSALNATLTAIPGYGGMGIGSVDGPNEAKRKAQLAELERERKQALVDANAALDISERERAAWADAQKNVSKGITEYSDKITELQGKLKGIDRKASVTQFDQWVETARQIGVYTDRVEKLKQIEKKDDAKAAREGERAVRRDITELTREQANLLAKIRGDQQIISQNPFLSADRKNAAMIPLITQEIAAMNDQIARDKALLRGTALDPAQYDQVKGKIQQAEVEVTLLGQKLKTLSFGGSLRADLTAWVNQFGTTAKQVAGIITSTLNTAIASTSQAITSLIFKTGNWKQAFAQAAQSIVQNIIQIALQWVVSRTLMSVLNRVFGQADSSAISGEASSAAASWAPAAVAASTASYGAAAGAGLTAYLAALATGTAVTIGTSAAGKGFEVGGYTGGREGAVAGIVHGAEYVFSAPAVRSLGVGYLDSLHSTVSRPGYAKGGFVGGNSRSAAPRGGGDVHVFNFSDPNKLRDAVMNSSAGRKIIVDVVNGHRVELGLA